MTVCSAIAGSPRRANATRVPSPVSRTLSRRKIRSACTHLSKGRCLYAVAATAVLGRGWRTDAIDETAKCLCESIPNASKGRETCRFTAVNRCRVRKAPMYPLGVAGKNRTALVRVVANGDHVVEALSVELTKVLGPVAGNVDSELRHHCDRLRSNDARVRSRRKHLDPVSSKRSQEPFAIWLRAEFPVQRMSTRFVMTFRRPSGAAASCSSSGRSTRRRPASWPG